MPSRRRVGRGQTPVPPAGLSEILTEHGGSFADLAPGGLWVAGGLDVGGLAPLRYGISLAIAADLPQAKIGRCDTHTVRY